MNFKFYSDLPLVPLNRKGLKISPYNIYENLTKLTKRRIRLYCGFNQTRVLIRTAKLRSSDFAQIRRIVYLTSSRGKGTAESYKSFCFIPLWKCLLAPPGGVAIRTYWPPLGGVNKNLLAPPQIIF